MKMKIKSFLRVIKKTVYLVAAVSILGVFPQIPISAAVPTAPSSLIAITVNGGRVDLHWTDNSIDETGINVERAPAIGGLGAGAYSHIGPNPTVSANTVAYSDTTVSALTAYWYRVAAVNADGSSFYSNAVRVITPHSTPQISLVTPTPPTATIPGGASNPLETTVTAPGSSVASAEYQLVMDNATGVFDAHDILTPQLDLTILSARAPSPVADSTPVSAGLPAGAIAEFEIRGTVAAVNSGTGEWQIGTAPILVYESVTGQPQSTTFVGARTPIAGDQVKIVAYRDVAGGPLIAKTITYIAPAATMGAATTILSFLYNGTITAMTPPVTALGYLVSGEVWDVGAGSFRIDAPDFPAYNTQPVGISSSVTVRFAGPKGQSNIARNIFNQITSSIQPAIDPHPVWDNTPIPQNYPSGTWLYVIVDGVVSGHDVVTGAWTIGSEGIMCYESAQTLVAPATIGDEVLMFCRRTLSPGPLIIDQVYNILPGPLIQPYKETAVETHLMYNGVIQSMGPNNWMVGGQTFSVDDPEGKARIDSAPFAAFVVGNPVTVEFEHAGEVVADNANWAPLSFNSSTNNWGDSLVLPAVTSEQSGRLFLRVTDGMQSGSTTIVSSILQIVPATVPADPSALQATVISGNQIDLAWTDNSSDENGFRVERAPDVAGNPGAWATLTTTGPNVVSFSDTTVTPDNTYHYRVFAYNLSGDSGPSNVVMATTTPVPADIVFITPARTTNVDVASKIITVQLQDLAGNPANASGNVVIDLASTAGTGLFDTSAAGAFDGSITSVTVLNGTNSASFYYKDSAAGTPDISASSAGLTTGQQAEIIVATGEATDIVFTPAPQTIDASIASGPITVQAQDSTGTPVNVATNTTVLLTSDSATGRFDTSAGGTFTQTSLSVIITTGTSDATFYYRDSAVGTPIITAASVGLNSGTQTETIVPGVAVSLDFTTQPAGALPGQVFGTQPVVVIKDTAGNVVTTATDNVTLAITSGTGNAGAALSGTTTVAAVNGVATFTDLSIDLTGLRLYPGRHRLRADLGDQQPVRCVSGPENFNIPLSAAGTSCPCP